MTNKHGRFRTLNPPKSVSEFLAAVEKIHKKWLEDFGYDYGIWFRGQGSASFSLTPGLYRPEYVKTDENTFRHHFKLKAFPYLSDATYSPLSDWDWYFLMQHHGLPTRLLDWTESALTALYFAISARSNSSAGVWVLNPWKLNYEVAKIGELIPISTNPLVGGYLAQPWDKTPLPGPPVAIQPPHNSRRIAAQKGMFTMHGSNQSGLESFPAIRDHLALIVIPGKARGSMRNELARAGVTESSLFPELAGLCKEIRDAWKNVE